MLDFRLLGPVQAVVRDAPVDLRGRQVALLAVLALARGRVVSRDRACEALWGERPPANPRNALQVVVSRLRSALGDDVVRHHAGGYALVAPPGTVDVERFEGLLERGGREAAAGDAARAAATLRAALAVWRGPALADVRDEEFALPEVARLEELRATCLEGRIEAELALGEGPSLVGELRGLVAEHPLRERLRAALMVALYRAGRQADALDAYREARTALAEGLGLEPSAELRRIEWSILQHDDPFPGSARRGPAVRALPLAASPLIGRAAELGETTALLLRATRLLTLTGPGGSGKTRLAVELADAVAAAFPDGAQFVPLAPLRDPGAVAGTVARALGGAGRPRVDGLAALPALVAGRRLLVVLDNAEHLRDAVAAVAAAIVQGDGPRVLVTSRERLGLDAEMAYEVPPLAPADGVALFVSRARRHDPAFAADADVAELCARLDWLPLALELAAARTALFSPAGLRERLAERLDELDAGPAADPRQRTLRATTEWSVALLDSESLRAFRRLSAFAADASWEAVEAVCQTSPDAVLALVERSLVRRRVGDDGRPRFGMLETVRQLAAELLAADPDEQLRCRERHAVAVVERAEALHAREGPVPVLRLEAERADGLLALAFAGEVGDVDLALRVVAALHTLWRQRGPYGEGVAAIEAALARGGGARARGRALLALADLVSLQGDNARGLALATDARTASAAAGDTRTEARALNLLGNAAFGIRDMGAAIGHYEQAIDVLAGGGDSADGLAPLANLGHACIELGETVRARRTLEGCLARAAAIGDRQRTSACLHSLGVLELVEERPAAAVEALHGGLEVARELGLVKYQIDILAIAGCALVLVGDAEEGVRVLGAAEAHARAIGMTSDPEGSVEARVRDEAVRGAMRALGPARYGAVYAAGRALALDAVVADVLRVPVRA